MDFDEMIQAAQSARIVELEERLARARRAYFNPDAPGLSPEDFVTDDVYDAWRDELIELKIDSPEVTAIGAAPDPSTPWVSVAHDIPMGSLDKVQTPEQMAEWIAARAPVDVREPPLLVTEKLDGISIHVKYESGCFVQAVTRGDGLTGEDITRNVARMKGVPARLPVDFTGSLRGEIIMLRSDHAAHFPEKANTRNGAAGVAKRLDGKGCEYLTVMFYQVAEGKDFATEGDQFTWLRQAGFNVPNWYVTSGPEGHTPHALWVSYQQSIRNGLDYDIDGLVVRFNDLAYQISLGEKDGRPTGAVAFKFAAISRETVLRRIDNQVGSTGRITPVAVFDPVNLLGAQVTNASLYNWRYIREMHLDVGARVLIARANDVIPRVMGLVQGVGTIAEPPSRCPRCDTPTEWDGEYITCPNEAGCPAQAVGRVKRFVQAHNMLGWGDGLIERLVEDGLVKSVPDLFRLTAEQLAGVERMGAKSAEKVLKTLWAKASLPIEDLLGSLSIPLCGKDTIQMVTAAGYDTLTAMRAATLEELQAIPGLGPVKAASLHRWLDASSSVVEELATLGVTVKDRVGGALTGMSFCFTGASKLPRPKLIEIATAAGGVVKSSVTKNLSYLVMADPNLGTTKARAARKNGTQCISEETFLTMAGYDQTQADQVHPTPVLPEVGIDASVVDEI